MSQSGFIASMLVAGFVLYVAREDRLKTYLAVIWGPTADPKPTAQVGGTTGFPIPGAAPGGGGGGGAPDWVGEAAKAAEGAALDALVLA